MAHSILRNSATGLQQRLRLAEVEQWPRHHSSVHSVAHHSVHLASLAC